MELREALSTYLGGDQQGQLVIKFNSEKHLCKITVENGQAVYLSLGLLGPEEALKAMEGKAAEWCNFIKGLPVRKRLAQPLNQTLLSLFGCASGEVAEPPSIETEEALLNTNKKTAKNASPEQVNAAIDLLIDRIGPLGTILAEKAFSSLSYTSGTSMNALIYNRFIAILAAEISPSERQAFIDDSVF